MSNGDDEGAEGTEEVPPWAAEVEAFESQLEAIESALEAAETEAHLDDIEADVETVESDLDSTELVVPEPEEDEEPEDPAEPLEGKIEDLRDDIEEQRGPYGEDVAKRMADAASVVRDTRWTRDGEPAVTEAVSTFLEAASEELEPAFASENESLADLADAIESVGEVAADGRLDADADGDTIAALLDAADSLDAALEAAEEWTDLEIAEQLRREGFYDRLSPENRKDFPPELNVVRIAEAENDVERILLALDSLDSDFMQENCLDALRRLGPEEAFEPVQALAQRREVGAIEVLGKIGDERALDTLIDFVDSGNPPLQKATIRALGEIGSPEASQPIANVLADDEPAVRSIAARALGLLGDTRAIEPLSDRLADDSETDEVRASAAWALVQIGTQRALNAAAKYDDDRDYNVQIEAQRAKNATP